MQLIGAAEQKTGDLSKVFASLQGVGQFKNSILAFANNSYVKLRIAEKSLFGHGGNMGTSQYGSNAFFFA
ncbi:MAG: hypothetical protein NTZ78_02195 [Candidatus Aureabacteria bacterium]|nr:hypothetical protein [Candidatus Auribacterota bacterium]